MPGEISRYFSPSSPNVLILQTAFFSTLASFRPDLVGVTGYTAEVPQMWEVCRQVKAFDPAITTVAGGYHVTLCPHDFDREDVDIIVVGEGELTVRELVTALEEERDLSLVEGISYRKGGRLVATPRRPLVKDLSVLPLPARHLSDQYRKHYHFHFWENPYLVEMSRGCPFRCTFCAVWMFHRRQCRYKSPERVLDDLKAAPSRVICFVDDNFLQRPRQTEKLHQLVKESGLKARYWIQARSDSIVRHPQLIRKWAEVGLDAALVGFEKIDEKELAAVHKKSSISTNERAIEVLHEYGVDIWGTFIVDPQWTAVDFDALIEYVQRWKINFPIFTILTPIPGTLFFQEKMESLTSMNYGAFDFLHTVLPTKLPLEEFYANMARLYAQTSMGLNELRQRVRSGRIPISALGRVREVLRDVTNPEAYLRSVPNA